MENFKNHTHERDVAVTLLSVHLSGYSGRCVSTRFWNRIFLNPTLELLPTQSSVMHSVNCSIAHPQWNYLGHWNKGGLTAAQDRGPPITASGLASSVWLPEKSRKCFLLLKNPLLLKNRPSCRKLRDNLLTGTIPTEIGQLQNLQTL